MRDYAWQAESLNRYRGLTRTDYLNNACPGAGKTNFGVDLLFGDISTGASEKGCILSPGITVNEQWQKALSKKGLEFIMDVDFNHKGISDDYQGVILTYQTLSNPKNVEWLDHFCRKYSTTSILDELHHLADDQTWGEGAERAFARARRRVGLTGTAFRSKGKILGVTYGDDGYCLSDIKDGVTYGYTFLYRHGVMAGINRLLEFPTVNGDMTWKEYDGMLANIITSDFDKELSQEQQRHRLLTALEPDSGWMTEMLKGSVKQLRELRTSIPDAAALYICMDYEHAKAIRSRLLNEFGIDAALVHTKEDGSHKVLDDFKISDRAAIVSVQMVTEGVDIPRLRVLGWATNITTDSRIAQAVGRINRNTNEDGLDTGYIYFPKDPVYLEYAKMIMEDCKVALDARMERETKDYEPREDGGPRPAPSWEKISATGRMDITVYKGVEYTLAQIGEASVFKDAHAYLANVSVAEVAYLLREIRGDSFGVAVNEIIPAPHILSTPVVPVVTPEPLEMQKKRLKRVCQKKAAELVKIIHPTKPKDEVGPLIARVHERWAAMPGHHYQSDSRIGVPELEQKSVWLDGLISVARTERLNHAT